MKKKKPKYSISFRDVVTKTITELLIRLAPPIPNHPGHLHLHHLLRLRPARRHNLHHYATPHLSL